MKILVIGDSCEDIFRYGRVDRLAPEAPIPVIIPDTEKSNPGMAGNVVRNIKALNHNVDFITNTEPIKKIRYVCSKYNHLLLRVDENDRCQQIKKDVLLNIKWNEYEAIVISDYNKGFLSKEDIKFISENHFLTFLDTKKELGDWVKKITFIKINYQEYLNNESIIKNNQNIQDKVIITRGKYGCDYQNKNYPTKEVPVKDVSGAGDTFLAGLVVKYINTHKITKAIEFAQECTTIVVQKLGVSTI